MSNARYTEEIKESFLTSIKLQEQVMTKLAQQVVRFGVGTNLVYRVELTGL